MGIRHLTSTLRPYAEPCVLDADSRVVIDGPSLAYHIIHLCYPRHGSTSPFAQPSYELLATTALAWLDELQRRGPTVAAIYFDGHLPPHKVPERLERSLKISRQLNNFFLSTPHGVSDEAGPAPTKVKLFPEPKPRASDSTGSLPVPPFAVHAICDALRQSDRYGHLTQLVPEEADCYCADSLRLHGGVVLTSDSDLVVFDLGKTGSVVFMSDIRPRSGVEAEVNGLSAMSYSPIKISERLGLPASYGLSALAYELHLDPHLSEGRLLEKSKKAASIKESPGGYARFMVQYRIFPMNPADSGTIVSPADIVNMDSRVAELAIQSLSSDPPEAPSEQEGRHGDGDRGLQMFLPPLVDAWTRTSAWETSTLVRSLAYCILQLASNMSPGGVREYRRLSSAKSGGTAVAVPAQGEVHSCCVKLMELITTIRGSLDNNEAGDLTWTILSMHHDINWSQENGKQALALHVLGSATDSEGNIRDRGTWDVLHFVAQLQGMLYSLRMLKQALDFMTRRGKQPEDAALTELSASLSDHLPPITGFVSVHDIGDLPRRLKAAGGLELLQNLTGLSEPIVFGPREDRRSKKKRKRAAQGGDAKSGSQAANKARNRFSVLDAVGSDQSDQTT